MYKQDKFFLCLFLLMLFVLPLPQVKAAHDLTIKEKQNIVDTINGAYTTWLHGSPANPNTKMFYNNHYIVYENRYSKAVVVLYQNATLTWDGSSLTVKAPATFDEGYTNYAICIVNMDGTPSFSSQLGTSNTKYDAEFTLPGFNSVNDIYYINDTIVTADGSTALSPIECEGVTVYNTSGDSGGSDADGDGGILGFLKGILNDIRSDLQALGSGITSLVSGLGDIIQNALKAVFVPSDGFLDEKLDSLKLTVGKKFGLESMNEIDSWLTDMDEYKPNTTVHFWGHDVTFLSLDFWTVKRSFYFSKIKDFLRVFLYPILLFGNWKYMVWVIRGSNKSGDV